MPTEPSQKLKQGNKIVFNQRSTTEQNMETFSLNNASIIIVGGEEKYFKDSVEQLNGNLRHFRGKKSNDYPKSLNDIKLVCFYIEECSHVAVEQTKLLCKKEDVPFCFIRGARNGLKRTLFDNQNKINNKLS